MVCFGPIGPLGLSSFPTLRAFLRGGGGGGAAEGMHGDYKAILRDPRGSCRGSSRQLHSNEKAWLPWEKMCVCVYMYSVYIYMDGCPC